ncbi:10471_t:CDS:10, partial [Funneliformis geosporum]
MRANGKFESFIALTNKSLGSLLLSEEILKLVLSRISEEAGNLLEEEYEKKYLKEKLALRNSVGIFYLGYSILESWPIYNTTTEGLIRRITVLTDLVSIPKIDKERLRYVKYLQAFWLGVIEECVKNSKKRKLVEDKPSKKNRSDISWVRGDVPATEHAIMVRVRKDDTIGELKDMIKEKIDTPVKAKDIKLWKIEIPDNNDDELANFSLQDRDILPATQEIEDHTEEWKKCNTNSLRNGINCLLNDHNVDKLCLYIEPKLKELIKRGNLYDDRELVTKVLFHALLLDIPNHLVDTEVPINVYHNKVKKNNTLYADLLIVEVNNAKRNRFIFEFKNKSVNFLDLQIKGKDSNWEVMERRANKVDKMSRRDVLQLKCGNAEKFDNGKTIKKIFNGAREQLLKYVHNLKEDDRQNHREFITSAFVVMAVFSQQHECLGYFSVNFAGGLHEFADSQFGHIFVMERISKLLETQAFEENSFTTGWLDTLIFDENLTAEKSCFVTFQ